MRFGDSRWHQKAAIGQSKNSLNVVENKRDYISRLQAAVEQLHKCAAVYTETIPMHEVFQGQTVWQEEIEVFALYNHPRAKRAYGWIHREGNGDQEERFAAVLEIPPVVSPVSTVHASIIVGAKGRRK
jgi:hypothetical protein